MGKAALHVIVPEIEYRPLSNVVPPNRSGNSITDVAQEPRVEAHRAFTIAVQTIPFDRFKRGERIVAIKGLFHPLFRAPGAEKEVP